MANDPLREMRRYWEQAFNGRDVSLLGDLLAIDFVDHAALPGTPPGRDGHAALLKSLWTAFPDAHFHVRHLAYEEPVVVCVGTLRGTHEGEIFGVPGSGRQVAWRQCHLFTVDAEGRATERHSIRDDLELMLQMGGQTSA